MATRPGASSKKLAKSVKSEERPRKKSEGLLQARGRSAITQVNALKVRPSENLVALGEALSVLTNANILEALGHTDFASLCRAELDLAPAVARRWMTALDRLPVAFIERVSPERALGVLSLADAMGEGESPEGLADRVLKLPSGEELAVETASLLQLEEAARQLRHAQLPEGKRTRGFTLTPDERKVHASLQKRLKSAPKDAQARVRLVAQRDGLGPRVEVSFRLPMLAKVLALLEGSGK